MPKEQWSGSSGSSWNASALENHPEFTGDSSCSRPGVKTFCLVEKGASHLNHNLPIGEEEIVKTVIRGAVLAAAVCAMAVVAHAQGNANHFTRTSPARGPNTSKDRTPT
jgi:hypothetical protein